MAAVHGAVLVAAVLVAVNSQGSNVAAAIFVPSPQGQFLGLVPWCSPFIILLKHIMDYYTHAGRLLQHAVIMLQQTPVVHVSVSLR